MLDDDCGDGDGGDAAGVDDSQGDDGGRMMVMAMLMVMVVMVMVITAALLQLGLCVTILPVLPVWVSFTRITEMLAATIKTTAARIFGPSVLPVSVSF